MLGKAEMGLPRHRHLTRKQVARIAPDFAPETNHGAIRYYDAQVDDEVDHYLRRVEAERQSQLMPTDQEADEARVKAPDIV